MILNEDDFSIYGDKVKLEVWLRKHEMDEILKNQEIVERLKNTLDDLEEMKNHHEGENDYGAICYCITKLKKISRRRK